MQSVQTHYRPVPQPQPKLNEAGDCGACCLAGFLGITVEAAYRLRSKRSPAEDDGPHHFDVYDLRGALVRARYDYDVDRVIDDTPLWPWDAHEMQMEYGLHNRLTPWSWLNYLVMGLDAGYCIFTTVNFQGDGLGANHWVIINGYREQVDPPENGASRVNMLLRIGCSVRGEYEIERNAFLKNHGGYVLTMARRRS